MNLCGKYLSDRGISEATITRYGIELDELASHKKARERLGQKFAQGVNEAVWFPLTDKEGNIIGWIARPLPSVVNTPKFVCALGSAGVPYVPKDVYGIPHGKPLIITEGPVKALACAQAGVAAIGINGVWGIGTKNSAGLVTVRADLLSALDWRGRKVCLAFDADSAVNPDVRQAMIRAYFILSTIGAEVHQMTLWSLSQGKGIDDYLFNSSTTNGAQSPPDVLAKLMEEAAPFAETVRATPLDIALVKSELEKVVIHNVLRSQLTKPLAEQLGVPVGELRKIQTAAKDESGDFGEAEAYPYPVIGSELLTELRSLVEKHVYVDANARVAIALFVVLTYFIDAVNTMQTVGG